MSCAGTECRADSGTVLFTSAGGLTVRLAAEADMDALLRVFSAARAYMRRNGNPTQWGESRPTRGEIEENLNARCCYVVERGAAPDIPAGDPGTDSDEETARKDASRRVICGTFAVKFGPDPMYASIDGKWLSSGPYVAIHALASDGTARGVADLAIRFAEEHPSRFLSGQLNAASAGAAPYSEVCPDEPVRFLRVDTHRNNRLMQAKFAEHGFTYCGIVRMIIDGTERLAYEKQIPMR